MGGYGRRELSLGSDLDLLFLYRGKLNPYVETLTESISHHSKAARPLTSTECTPQTVGFVRPATCCCATTCRFSTTLAPQTFR